MYYQGYLWFYFFIFDFSFGICLISMCNVVGIRSCGVEVFMFVVVVILMVGVMMFEEVCLGEGFGVNFLLYQLGFW